MKILLIASYFPYPLHSGGQVRLFNLLRNLGEKHEITLVCEARQTPTKSDLEKAQKYCQKILTVTRGKQWSLRNILAAGFSFYSFLLVGHKNQAMTKIISQELKAHKYDLVHVETFYIMHNLPAEIHIPIVLVEHNIEWKIYQHWVDGFWGVLLKPLLYFDVWKMRLWEKHFWQRADVVMTVSDLDQKTIEKEVGKTPEIVPNGVDCDYFEEIKKQEPKVPTIVFVGSFKWMQNRDAASYLLGKLWPEIRHKVKNVQLWIIGNDALKFVSPKKSEIMVEEGVADIRKVYANSTVLLAPIRLGGGTKFKILESLASGLPIVTTPKGVEGMGPDTNGILVGNSDDELINFTVDLLNDPTKRKNIEVKEKQFVRANFDWKDISQKLEQVYIKLLNN